MYHQAATISLCEKKPSSLTSKALMSCFGWHWRQRHCTMSTCQNLHVAAALAKVFYSVWGRHKLGYSLQTADFFSASHAVKSATFYAVNQQHTRTGVCWWNKKLVSHHNEIDQSYREEWCSSNSWCNETFRIGAYQVDLNALNSSVVDNLYAERNNESIPSSMSSVWNLFQIHQNCNVLQWDNKWFAAMKYFTVAHSNSWGCGKTNVHNSLARSETGVLHFKNNFWH